MEERALLIQENQSEAWRPPACKSQHRRLEQVKRKTDRSARDIESRSERSRSSSPNTRSNQSQDPTEGGGDMIDEDDSEPSDRAENRFSHESHSPLITRWASRVSEMARRREDIDDLKRRLKIAQQRKIQAENDYNSILQDLEQRQGEQRAAVDESVALLKQVAGCHPDSDST
ncbi:hypothetical protein ZTR_10835 [Talaromyces verruculosus]|nr:hypothetical protein ZTR_10835 [Talaromyces verruculosus]